MTANRLAIAAALACLFLTGCGKKAAEGNKASGEVLEGTISDAMIATDQSRVEPPLAPRVDKAGVAKGDTAKAGVGDEADDTATPDAVPTPQASPVPKPSTSEPAE